MRLMNMGVLKVCTQVGDGLQTVMGNNSEPFPEHVNHTL